MFRYRKSACVWERERGREGGGEGERGDAGGLPFMQFKAVVHSPRRKKPITRLLQESTQCIRAKASHIVSDRLQLQLRRTMPSLLQGHKWSLHTTQGEQRVTIPCKYILIKILNAGYKIPVAVIIASMPPCLVHGVTLLVGFSTVDASVVEQ